MRLVAVPDKLRGTATAAEAAAAVARGAVGAGWEAEELPLADGGEGTLDVFGGPDRTTVVAGPLGEPVAAGWRCEGRTAVIETARASGLSLAARNDPLRATTRGTGELIAAAVAAGCRHVLVGVGGSATTDGGLGALEALGAAGCPAEVDLVVACDVRATFVEAAALFGPQKGATPLEVVQLHQRLERLADRYLGEYGVDVRGVPGSGAAGGLAGGLLCLGARLVPGFDAVSDELGLPARIADAELLVTAEGRLDAQSFAGKVVGGVAALGARAGVPVLAVVGEVDEGVVVPPGLTVVSLVDRFGEVRARAQTLRCLEAVVAEQLSGGRQAMW